MDEDEDGEELFEAPDASVSADAATNFRDGSDEDEGGGGDHHHDPDFDAVEVDEDGDPIVRPYSDPPQALQWLIPLRDRIATPVGNFAYDYVAQPLRTRVANYSFVDAGHVMISVLTFAILLSWLRFRRSISYIYAASDSIPPTPTATEKTPEPKGEPSGKKEKRL
mmetsp:Transcript_16241/g.42560  ORF Transcript_16241/g.42560 Transcript_16241/m.42560 type:complete len:166 (-) Transcript_16241:262-759(-)